MLLKTTGVWKAILTLTKQWCDFELSVPLRNVTKYDLVVFGRVDKL